ncbi:MAG TPA: hypothetical protein VF219_11025 [Vicinamibacterales bacterium]
MTDNDNEIVALWQKQTAEGFRMTSEDIQMNLQALESKLRAQTRFGYLVCAFLVIAFSYWAFVEHDLLMRIGAAAAIIAFTFLGVQVYQSRFRRDAAAPPAALPSLEHLRNELQRRVDFHRGKRLWSRLLLLMPAGLFFFFAFARAHPEGVTIIRFEIATFVVVGLAAIPLNLKTAKEYQRQIDDLERQKER